VVFVDTNVFVYAVGRPHPLRDESQARLHAAVADGVSLATSAEVLQELMHIYLPVERLETLDSALRLANDLTTIWPIDASDVAAARDLVASEPGLSARDLLHLATCRRYGASGIMSFDRGLLAAYTVRS
jgi:predicted nucleic acid-binding protein